MREIRQSGSEGGGGREASPYLYTIWRRSAAASFRGSGAGPHGPENGSILTDTLFREAALTHLYGTAQPCRTAPRARASDPPPDSPRTRSLKRVLLEV